MNAASLNKFSARCAAAGEALWPVTVTISGTDYAAECPRPPDEKRDLEAGYETLPDKRVVRIRKALLPDAPALNSSLTMDEKSWKIVTLGGDNAASAVWVLGLEPKK